MPKGRPPRVKKVEWDNLVSLFNSYPKEGVEKLYERAIKEGKLSSEIELSTIKNKFSKNKMSWKGKGVPSHPQGSFVGEAPVFSSQFSSKPSSEEVLLQSKKEYEKKNSNFEKGIIYVDGVETVNPFKMIVTGEKVMIFLPLILGVEIKPKPKIILKNGQKILTFGRKYDDFHKGTKSDISEGLKAMELEETFDFSDLKKKKKIGKFFSGKQSYEIACHPNASIEKGVSIFVLKKRLKVMICYYLLKKKSVAPSRNSFASILGLEDAVAEEDDEDDDESDESNDEFVVNEKQAEKWENF